jgi:hypothetical protein
VECNADGCNVIFEPYRSYQRFCSHRCRNRENFRRNYTPKPRKQVRASLRALDYMAALDAHRNDRTPENAQREADALKRLLEGTSAENRPRKQSTLHFGVQDSPRD